MLGYIYKTKNLANGKIYIGQHKRGEFDPYYLGSGTVLKVAIKKYGRESFECEIMDRCATLEELNEREIFRIEEFQSRNSSIGYNLATGGNHVIVGCTAREISLISKLLCGITCENVNKSISTAKNIGLRIYNTSEPWIPTSNNSNEIKMTAADVSVVISLYSANQIKRAKYYATEFGFLYWKYNLMIEIQKLPVFMDQIKADIESGNLKPEKRGVGLGTSGVFFETSKPYRNSSRMPLII